jgi:hypothetical protein
MGHIIPALEAEYQKQERLVVESELGNYLHYARRRIAR